MIDFTKHIKSGIQAKKVNPVEIYDTLDRESGTGPLRPAQFNVLQQWFTNLRDKKDLIIKMHTGAGKTLIGLLIAMSYINSKEGPAIYICPNIYLMQQACTDAKKFGIPFCFINNDNQIPDDFTQGKSVLITYVQKVFNGYSIFGTGNKSVHVGCIILDDSHACIDSMLASCTIQIFRNNPAYAQLVNLFEDDLSDQGGGTYQDLINNTANVLMPFPYWSWQSKISEVTQLISQQVSDNNIKFAWPLIRDQLGDCKAFISSDKIEISPMCMPIQQYGIFSNATHRILMSATTQEDTFFIKGLGLSVDAVANPLIDQDYNWSGEKMILIPDSICENSNTDELISQIISSKHDYGIAVLTPSFEKAKKYTQKNAILANNPDPSIKMYNVLQTFLNNHKDQTIVFANRYDGIDLPDDTCRILILDSIPYYDSLSDRYEELCRSESGIIQIKTAQKIEQGLGRSVRGEKDYCVILIMGSDLIKFVRSINTRSLFSVQTQKQIEIGFEIADIVKKELASTEDENESRMLFSTINQCLIRDEGWKQYYSATMDDVVQQKTDKSQLYTILKMERDAYEAVAVRNYDAASHIMQNIINLVPSETEKGWYLQEKACLLYHSSHSDANENQISAFRKNNQLLKPQVGITYNRIKYPINYSRTQRIIQQINEYSTYNELSIQIEDILANMSFGVIPEKAEDAFYRIGKMLGFISQRPDKEIRKGPDVLWCISNNKYILIECKTQVELSRQVISKNEAGQMIQHCAWFEEEYGNGTVFYPTMVIPTNRLAQDAYLKRDIGIISRKNLNDLRRQIKEFFKEFKSVSFSGINSEYVNKQLLAHKLYDDTFINAFTVPTKKD